MITIATLLIFGVGVIAGAVFSYLFLRANPNKKAAVDAFTDEQSAKLKDLE